MPARAAPEDCAPLCPHTRITRLPLKASCHPTHPGGEGSPETPDVGEILIGAKGAPSGPRTLQAVLSSQGTQRTRAHNPETNPHLVGKSPEVSHVCAALRPSAAAPEALDSA